MVNHQALVHYYYYYYWRTIAETCELWVVVAAVTCEPGWTKCRGVNACIMDVWLCDGDADCIDNSDEDQQQCGM